MKFSEIIYNTFLRVSRTKQDKPFRFRKDFSKFEEDPNYIYVMKLENFFKRFPHIKVDDFFKAPYEVYPEKAYYDLSFYLSPKAIKVYTIFNKARADAIPDSPTQIEFIQSSFSRIWTFCSENKINFAEYLKHTTGIFPTFMVHLKEHKISVYVLFGWPDFEDVFSQIQPKEYDFMLRHLYGDIENYRTKLIQSIKAKKLVREGYRTLDNYQKTHGFTQ